MKAPKKYQMCPQWEKYVGKLAPERGVTSRGEVHATTSQNSLGAVEAMTIEPIPETDLSLNENESMSRFVAYASPYLFWTTVVGLSAGLLLLQ